MIATGDLRRQLTEITDIDEYLDANQTELITRSFSEIINELMDTRGVKRSDLIKQTNIYTRYGYEILSGIKKPSRDKVLLLSLALGISVIDTNHLLNASGNNELYPRSGRDSIIMFALNNNMSIMQCNSELYAHEFKVLS